MDSAEAAWKRLREAVELAAAVMDRGRAGLRPVFLPLGLLEHRHRPEVMLRRRVGRGLGLDEQAVRPLEPFISLGHIVGYVSPGRVGVVVLEMAEIGLGPRPRGGERLEAGGHGRQELLGPCAGGDNVFKERG